VCVTHIICPTTNLSKDTSVDECKAAVFHVKTDFFHHAARITSVIRQRFDEYLINDITPTALSKGIIS
jgi:hypothetical protein